MMARKVMAGASGVPITSPNHPDVIFFLEWESITGPTAFDSSPNSNDVTLTGTTVVSGKNGNAVKFDFTSLDKGSFASAMIPTTGEFCFCSWINLDQLASASGQSLGLIAQYYNNVNNRMNIAVNSASDKVQIQIGGSIMASASTVPATTDTFVMVDRDAANLVSIYIGDPTSPDISGIISGTIDNQATTIGAYEQGGATGYMDGWMDTSVLLNRSLTTAERVAYWNGGAGV